MQGHAVLSDEAVCLPGSGEVWDVQPHEQESWAELLPALHKLGACGEGCQGALPQYTGAMQRSRIRLWPQIS